MDKTIFVINPNSLTDVTRRLDQSMECLRLPGGPLIECLTLPDGPAGIQTQHDVDTAGLAVGAKVKELEAQFGDRAGAYVIACFSDPGLYLAREITDKPVLGISECGMLTAMTMGQNIGVIAILDGSIARHSRTFAGAGISSRVTGELALGLNVSELGNPDATRKRLREVGARLINEKEADVLVLGCAGMPQYREWLQNELGKPVVDPSLATVSIAVGRVLLGSGGQSCT